MRHTEIPLTTKPQTLNKINTLCAIMFFDVIAVRSSSSSIIIIIISISSSSSSSSSSYSQ